MDQNSLFVNLLVDLIDNMNHEYNKFIGQEDCINRCDTIILLIYSYYNHNLKSEYIKEQIMKLARIKLHSDYLDYVHDSNINNENTLVLNIDEFINNVWLKYEEDITEYYGGNSTYNMYGVTSIILRKLIKEINK